MIFCKESSKITCTKVPKVVSEGETCFSFFTAGNRSYFFASFKASFELIEPLSSKEEKVTILS